nr:hypothetical protein [Deltaproteobacteria bacterium]
MMGSPLWWAGYGELAIEGGWRDFVDVRVSGWGALAPARTTRAGTMQLSSQHRVDTGNVINMVEITQGTWTNLDADALAGGVDAIGGTLVVNTWDPAAGVADIEFQGVSLLNVVDGTVCTIDGSVVADEIYP